MDVAATIAESLIEAKREINRLKIMRTEVSRSEIQGTSPQQVVKVTQTLGGEIVKVEIRPGAFRDYDESSLSRMITELLHDTRKAALHSAKQLTEKILAEREEDGRG